jgi:nitroreductase
VNRVSAVRGIPVDKLEGLTNMFNNIISRPAEVNFDWAARQTYIALGTGLIAAANEKVDATPMEGFDPKALDEVLGLKEKGLRSVALLALGYRDTANDYSVNMPKVRREKDDLFIVLN